MGRLHTLAAGTALLALGVKAQFSYMGCTALDTSTIKKTTELYPQSPATCLAYCNGIGYSYAGLQAQFCSCWEFSPVITKKYADSQNADCSFNCDEPYNREYCGGIDLSTLGFLYSYYAGVAPPIVGGPSAGSTAPGAIATSSGDVIISPPATSSAADAVATPPSSSDAGGVIPPQSSTLVGGQPTLPSTSAGEVLPPASSGISPPGSPGPSESLPPASSGISGPSGSLPPASSGISPPGIPGPSESLPSASSGILPPGSPGPSESLPSASSGISPPVIPGPSGSLPSASSGILPPGSPGPSESLPSASSGISPPVIPGPSGSLPPVSSGISGPSGSLPPASSGISPPGIPGPSGSLPPASSGISGPSGSLPPASSGISPPGSPGTSGSLPPASSGISGPSGPLPPASSGPSGVVVPTPSGPGPVGSGTPSPSSTGVGGAPIQTIVPLRPGQPFVINIAPYLRTVGDQALSWIPSPPWFLYNANITSFYGTIPLDFPIGPLIITVTAGQRTTGSNGVQRRQVPAGTYTFAIELLIVAPGVPASPVPTPSSTSVPGGIPSPVLPSYTNTVYQTITSTITRCPVCPPEVTVFAKPIGTTCITAEVYTTPCEITVTRTRADGVVTPMVTTTLSRIPYNPAESTIVVTTVSDLTTKYTTTLLVAVTRTIQKLLPTGEAGPVQPPPPPPGPPAPAQGAPFAGPGAPPPKVAIGTGAANNGSQPAPTMPVTAGASMDRFVEMFVLLCGVAFGALLLL